MGNVLYIIAVIPVNGWSDSSDLMLAALFTFCLLLHLLSYC